MNGDGALSWVSRGTGPAVVLLPSLGRPATDFAELAAALDDAGYDAIAVEPHGIGASRLPAPEATLHDLARDVAAVITAVATEPVHLVGHAFGNRLARCVSSDRPELVRSLTVLGCGGKVAPEPEVLAALIACFDTDLDTDAHRQAVVTAFFAPGNEPPATWLDGWYPDTAQAQRAALARTDTDDWWLPPPPIPVLAMVGLDDRIAPLANARGLVASLGERGRLEEIAGAGHALLPERPDDVAAALLRHLAEH